MAESIATAYVQIEPTFEGVAGKLKTELGDASDSAGKSAGKSFGSGFGSVIGGTTKVMAGALAAGGAAIAGLGASFVKSSGEVASYGDNIDKMSQKMGLTAEAYQEWDAVMQHSGTSMETMKASMKTLANAAEGGNKAFEALGITQEEVANMSQQDLFEATIAGLQNVEDTTQRTYLAGQLLGRGATELGALLNTSAEDTQAMRDRVRELGGVMSEDAVKAAAAYQDQLQDMQTAFSGLSRNMLAEFLPGMTTVMAGLTEIFSGNSEGGLGMISEGISSIVSGLTAALPQLLTVAASIVEALGQAILDNAPTLLQTGMDLVMQIGTFIIENAPLLFETATQLILQLATGLAAALPELIPTITEVVLNLCLYLIENIDLLIDAALQLMIGLATGLIQAIPILIEKAPIIISSLLLAFLQAIPKLIEAGKQIIETIKNAIQTYAPALMAKGQELMNTLKTKILEKIQLFFEIGKEIVEGIKQGIADAWESLINWFGEKIEGLVDGLKTLLKIGSPSKVFAEEVGQWIPAGIAQGIIEGMGVLEKTVDGMATDMVLGAEITAAEIPQASYDLDTNENDGVYKLLSTYLPIIAEKGKVEITLEGGLDRLFRAMQRESARNTTLVGYGIEPLTG